MTHTVLQAEEAVIRNQQVPNRVVDATHRQALQNQKSPKQNVSLDKTTSRSRFGLKSPVILVQVGILSIVFIGLFIAQFSARQSAYADNKKVLTSTVNKDDDAQPIDKLVSSKVAAVVAQQVELPIATSVVNRSDTIAAQAEMGQSDDSAAIAKPQSISTSTQNSSIKHYTTKPGDTVSKLANEFNISVNTIKWANNLSSDSLTPGRQLNILPISGVLYTVRTGDTADTLAAEFGTNAKQIISFNNAELTGLKPGQRIIVPGGTITETVPGVIPDVQSANQTDSAGSSVQVQTAGRFMPSFGGNGYAYGYCTWYVANKRAAAGDPVPTNWGNANTWSYLAAQSGFGTGRQPRKGAILQTAGGWGGFGHVAYVERVNADGSIDISEMNYAGWDRISTRHIGASQAGNYNYIY